MLRQRFTFTSALLLEAVLVLALLSAGVFSLLKTVVSPFALGPHIPGVVRDLGTQVLGDRYFGDYPTVRTELNQSVTVMTNPLLYSYGAAEIPRGRGEFSGPFEAQVNAYDVTGEQRLAFLGAGLAESLGAIVALLLLLRIVRTLRVGDPFILTNARRLGRIAVAVALGGTGASVLQAWGAHLVLSDAAIRPFVQENLHVTFVPLIAGMGIFLLAEVFRRGARMRDDLEGLV